MSEYRPGTLEWYVVHTYSGYENKVKDSLEKAAVNNNMTQLITEVVVPTEEVVELRNGKRVTTQRKTFPGYVLVRMIITNESWYVVRNTRGVTGFVGPESNPIPLTAEELERMLTAAPSQAEGLLQVGDTVRILSGALQNQEAIIQEVDETNRKVSVILNMFGKDTPTTLSFDIVEKIEH